MTDDGDRPKFTRPWEDADEPAAPEPSSAETVTTEPEPEDVDVDLATGETSLDDFTHDDYMAATTREYQGLAEEIAAAANQEYERQAVAAAMPGVGSGLVGFEDVTGRRGVSEEEVEAEEQQRASDLTLRVGSGLVLVGMFLGCLFLGGVWFIGLVVVAMVLSLGEVYATLRSRGYRPIALFGFLGVIGGAIAAATSGVGAFGIALTVTTAACALFYSVVVRRNPLENLAASVLGMVWVGLLTFAIVIADSESSVELVLLVVLLTAFFDIAAFFVGRAFGSRPIAPVVSPKKTWEGLAGGIIVITGLAAFLATLPVYDFMSVTEAVAVALTISVFAPLGDAAESVIKRALDTKDMGSILPGHGGMIDRIDALLFVLPAVYFLFRYLEYL